MSAALVTGGHGFAASWLVKALLERGDGVTVLDRPDPRLTDLGTPRPSALELHGINGQVEVVEADLRDAEAVSRAVEGSDVVFHLAAQTIVANARQSPRETFEVNVMGTWNVLEACREEGVPKLIFASSDKAYGASDELPYREDTPLRAVHTYDASKAAADVLARSYWHSYGLPVAVTRFANLYGGGDLNFSRLIPEAVSALLDGRRPVIRSDGTPERDFLYVEDASRAYLAIADALEDAAAGEAFNAGGEKPHSVAEVLQLLAEVSRTELEPDIRGSGNPEGEIDRQYVDSTKLREATGWRPEVDLRDGLARTIEWYREHPEARAPSG
ncbi:MAG: NAD-dependent epimerase/dehydratase family protein [Actinomycetota bacterium]